MHSGHRDRLEPDAAGCLCPTAFRLVLVAAQTVTILLTWPAWQARIHPAALPLLPLPQFDMGIPLLCSLAATAFRPRLGLPIHAAVLAWAMAADQVRIQPPMLSMLWLTCGTLGTTGGGFVARASLVSLWLFAGLHKLTSPRFFTITAPWLLSGLWPGASAAWALPFGIAVGATEVALAAGSLVPRWRIATAVAGCVFHLGTLLTLSPLGISWNREVWPWNAALACAGPALLAGWLGPAFGVERFGPVHRGRWSALSAWARLVGTALVLLPAGYWFGVVDAYLAHCLYANNTPRAFVCTPFSRTDIDAIAADFGLRLPPAHRLYPPFFLAVGRAGEWLEIEDDRWIAHRRGFARRKISWSELVPDDAVVEPPGGRRQE